MTGLLIVCGFLGLYAVLLFTGIAVHLFYERRRRAVLKRSARRGGYITLAGPESRRRLP